MIAPTDARHGTTRGYHAGCHDACCRAAMARYEKAGRLARLNGGRAIPAIGAQRRIQALMRLGYTSEDIATAAGWPERNYVLRILNGQKGKPTTYVLVKTHDAIADVYNRLSMRLPELDRYRKRTRSIAERKGFAPPLAWLNIDDINEIPAGRYQAHRRRDELDEAVVLRLLDGERLPMTRAERVEVVRRAIAAGWSETHIEAVTGIGRAMSKKRYGRGEAA